MPRLKSSRPSWPRCAKPHAETKRARRREEDGSGLYIENGAEEVRRFVVPGPNWEEKDGRHRRM